MRTLRALRTDRQDAAQGGIGNDVVLVGKKSRTETGLTNHIFGIGSPVHAGAERSPLRARPKLRLSSRYGVGLDGLMGPRPIGLASAALGPAPAGVRDPSAACCRRGTSHISSSPGGRKPASIRINRPGRASRSPAGQTRIPHPLQAVEEPWVVAQSNSLTYLIAIDGADRPFFT